MFYRSNRRLLAWLIALALALAACPQVLAEASRTVYTATDNAPVYDAQGHVLGTLSANIRLTVTDVKGDICQVERDGHTAYMKKSDLTAHAAEEKAPAAPTPAPTSQPQSATAYVARDGAKVYDAKGNAQGTLSVNTRITVTGVKDDVCRVEGEGRTGYMRKSDLSADPVAVTPAPTPTATPAPTASPAPKSATAYVSTEGAKVYDADGDVAGTLSLNTEVTVTAVKGEACQVVSGGKKGYMRRDDLSAERIATKAAPTAAPAPSGGSTVTPARGRAVEMDWWTSDIQQIFARGTVAQITDVETGLSWREKRSGGTNHADCQPLTAADTAAMKKAYGGKWSWNRRAVFVTINGVNYAASINGMPHGGGSITDNDFDGHHCIHFTNSRTHGTNKVCPLHQAAIQKAASTTL